MPLSWLSPCFQSFSPLFTSSLGPLVLICGWIDLCTFQDHVGLSNQLSCEAGSFSCCLNPYRFFTARGFEALFPHTGTLGCSVCLIPQLFFPVYPHKCGPAPSSSPRIAVSPLPRLPVSTPTTVLDECFFLFVLVVGLPYSLLFQQFQLFFVFKFVVLLMVVRGGTVCLSTPPSWQEVFMLPLISFLEQNKSFLEIYGD